MDYIIYQKNMRFIETIKLNDELCGADSMTYMDFIFF